MPSPLDVPWDKIQALYEHAAMSRVNICKAYDIKLDTLARRIERHKWRRKDRTQQGNMELLPKPGDPLTARAKLWMAKMVLDVEESYTRIARLPAPEDRKEANLHEDLMGKLLTRGRSVFGLTDEAESKHAVVNVGLVAQVQMADARTLRKAKEALEGKA